MSDQRRLTAMRQYDLQFPDRLNLYRQGLTDAEMGRRLRVPAYIIAEWRRNRGWFVNRIAPESRDEANVRKLLVRTNFEDQEIARILRTTPQAIAIWRMKNRIHRYRAEIDPVNPAKMEHRERVKFWNQVSMLRELRMTDIQIAKAMRTTPKIIGPHILETSKRVRTQKKSAA